MPSQVFVEDGDKHADCAKNCYGCPGCWDIFGSLSQLRMHIQNKHSITTDATAANDSISLLNISPTISIVSPESSEQSKILEKIISLFNEEDSINVTHNQDLNILLKKVANNITINSISKQDQIINNI
ncbi:hypothetical protein CU097_014490 [Rhizopus azygosporus]|uniref:C2H2-type domain-containing protein n=1 Tax=Rhizopus azygosporus TaxID=86630 RepID=A0A367K507_RHIAZ|nr:hypothetical protein CU097_014490 [Rhizopus azygosporus]